MPHPSLNLQRVAGIGPVWLPDISKEDENWGIAALDTACTHSDAFVQTVFAGPAGIACTVRYGKGTPLYGLFTIGQTIGGLEQSLVRR
jgi:hypothetical protein